MLRLCHRRIWKATFLSLLLLLLGAQDTVVLGDDDPAVKCDGNECVVSPETLLPTAMIPGAVYETKFDFPMIGPYVVQMKVTTHNTASLIVEGGFPIRDKFNYKLEKDTGLRGSTVRFSVELSSYLNGVLDKYWVSLTAISYDVEKDIPSVVVKIAAIVTFPLKLHRVNTVQV